MLENDLTADQQVQLYELMNETTKPAPQFMIKDDDWKWEKNFFKYLFSFCDATFNPTENFCL